MLNGKNVLVGVTGGIACYKACDLLSRLKKLGASVDVIMTENATKFVSPLTFETLSARPVTTDTFSRECPWEVEHIALAKKADLVVIAPATANIIAKLAHGIADDMLSTTCLAATAPMIICPAMNTAMLHAPITVENIAKLKARGVEFVDSACGILACGDVGDGRLAEIDEIVNAITKSFTVKRDLEGKSVLVTVGGTEENIDPVRVITNHSSGKMGIALVQEAIKRGAKVTAVIGRVSVDIPTDAEIIKVRTTDEMATETIRRADYDYIIMAAAPSDYKVLNVGMSKIKANKLNLELIKNIDISAEVGKIKKGKMVIFSAETDNLIENAVKKLEKKNADLVVANDVTREGAGFNTDTNIVTIIGRSGILKESDKLLKSKVAELIIDEMVKL